GALNQSVTEVSRVLASNTSGTVQYSRTAHLVAEVTSDAPVADVAAWVAGIAPVAMAYTDAHNVEVCGVIARDPSGRLGIILGTTDSPADCGFSHRNVPAGFVSTGETFH